MLREDDQSDKMNSEKRSDVPFRSGKAEGYLRPYFGIVTREWMNRVKSVLGYVPICRPLCECFRSLKNYKGSRLLAVSSSDRANIVVERLF